MGESCCPNRVARLAQFAGIRAQIGYKRRAGQYGGRPFLAVDNTLDRRFDVKAPEKAGVTDITYIRTLEGFTYLGVVLDLFARRVVGCSMQAGRRPTLSFRRCWRPFGDANRRGACWCIRIRAASSRAWCGPRS
jgi:transposase InsO family protein